METKSVLPDLPSEPKKLDNTVAVWSEMNQVFLKYNCLSLGEGAPGYLPPQFLRNFMIEAMDQGYNQYCRTYGHPILIQEIADFYGPKLNRTINPQKEILVASGANGALSSFIMALINPGDEMIIFEPTFPMYLDHLKLAGGILKSVPLYVDENKNWVFDPESLRKQLTQQTKLLILNSPHNPTGKCFTLDELLIITEILKEFPNCVVLSDEVYDFLTFDGIKHIPFSTIQDNWNKTVTIYSGGKLLNSTGWKIGWAIGPERIINLGGIINNTTSYCTNHPGQVAFANSLKIIEKPGSGEQENQSFVELQRKNFQNVRDFLKKEVEEMDLPWEPLPCQSGYFMLADISKCRHLVPEIYFKTHDYDLYDQQPANESNKILKNELYIFKNDKKIIPLDLAFSRWMGRENGVTMMPNSFFYHPKSVNITENFVRLAICKNFKDVQKACQRLRLLKI